MIARFVARPSPRTAAGILREVFAPVSASYAFRLWDGTEVRVGPGEPVGTAVIKSPETFVDLMRDPSPGNFAEAYVAQRIDLEGDLFATMEVANAVDEIKLSRGQRLRILASMLKRGRR